MQFGRFPRKTLLAATLIFAFSSANASFVEQIGTPVTPMAVMGTYAADAAIKPGLKAVIPPGWQLFHHQSVELPTGLSWEKDDTWVAVLNKFAAKQDIAVLIDWDKKQVFFRSTAMALQEQEKRQIISQAASTPLPAFKAPEPKPATTLAIAKPVEKAAEKSVTTVTTVTSVAVAAATPVSASPARAPVMATPAAAPLVVIASTAPAVAVQAPAVAVQAPAVTVQAPAVTVQAPAPAPVVAVAVGPTRTLASGVTLTSGVTLASTPVATASVSQMPVRVLTVAPAKAEVASSTTAVATKRSVRPPIKMATVIVASSSPTPDSKPFVATLPAEGTPVVRASASMPVAVMPAAGASAPVRVTVVTLPAPAPAPAPILVAVTPRPALVVTPAVVVAPAEAPAATPGAVAFNREPVSMVVATAGAKHGYTVSWEASQVMFPGPVTLLGADMGEDMNLVLRALGGRRAPIAITVYRSSNVVVVRDTATGTANVAFTDVPFSGRIRELAAPKSHSGLFAVAQVAAPLPAPVRVVTAPGYVMPAPVAAPAPVRVAPAYVAPAYVAPAVLTASEPVRVTPEPVRLETAVATIKKLEPAQPPVVATGRVYTLRVAAGGQLRDAIEAALEPGWSLKWEVKDDLVANSDMSATGESLMATLNQVLPRLKLSADIYKPSKLVVVREADQALDK